MQDRDVYLFYELVKIGNLRPPADIHDGSAYGGPCQTVEIENGKLPYLTFTDSDRVISLMQAYAQGKGIAHVMGTDIFAQMSGIIGTITDKFSATFNVL